MPRTAGVSGRVEVRRILLSPSPIRVWRCLASRRIGEPICSTVTVRPWFSAIAASLRCLAGGVAGIARVAAAALQGRDLQAAASGDGARGVLVLERVEGGAHEIVGVR